VDVRSFFITDSEPSMLMKPSVCAFDDPAEHSQTAAMVGPPLGQHRTDVPCSQLLSMRFRIIASISLDTVRLAAWGAGLAPDGRDAVHQRDLT
jgi:hypothetical protein